MKINVKQTFTEYDGSPITKSEFNKKTQKTETTPVTLQEILSNVVLAQVGNEPATSEDLGVRNQIAIKLYGANDPDLSLSERQLIIERLPKVYNSPRIFGLLTAILDPKE